MPEKIFDIFKLIPLAEFSAAFTPYIRKSLDETQISQFVSVFVKTRKILYKDKEPLQYIQHISVVDAVVNEFNVHKFLSFHFPRMLQSNPVIGQDIKNRVLKFQRISVGVAAAREEFIKTIQKFYDETGNQIP